jgi:hypothetical protein
MARPKNSALAGEPAVLRSWSALNHAIRSADEATCLQLLKAETAGRKRKVFIHRIHARLNRVRADRERRELLGQPD